MRHLTTTSYDVETVKEGEGVAIVSPARGGKLVLPRGQKTCTVHIKGTDLTKGKNNFAYALHINRERMNQLTPILVLPPKHAPTDKMYRPPSRFCVLTTISRGWREISFSVARFIFPGAAFDSNESYEKKAETTTESGAVVKSEHGDVVHFLQFRRCLFTRWQLLFIMSFSSPMNGRKVAPTFPGFESRHAESTFQRDSLHTSAVLSFHSRTGLDVARKNEFLANNHKHHKGSTETQRQHKEC